MADQDFNIKVVTSADLTGIRQTSAGFTQLQQQQQQAAQAAAAAGNVVGRLIGQLAGVGVVYGAIDQIKQMANEINRISTELAKHGQLLVSNAQKYAEQAKSASSEADVLKIGESALKGVEKAHQDVYEAASKELTVTQKITDSVLHLIQNVRAYGQASADSGRINKQIADQELKNATTLDQMARTAAKRAVELAEAYKDAFDKKKAEPFSQAIDEITQKIEEQEELQKRVGIENIESYIAIGKSIEIYKQQLAEIIKLEAAHKKSIEDKAKAAQEYGKVAADAERRAAELNKPKTPGEQATERRTERSENQRLKELRDRLSRANPDEAADIKDEMAQIQQAKQDRAEQEEKRKQAAEEAEREAAAARAEQQRIQAEQAEQKRAADEKAQDFREVKKYGRVLTEPERISENIKAQEEARQKKFQDDEAARQKAFQEQAEAARRGLTPEQLRNERAAKGQPDQAKAGDSDNSVVVAINNLSDKFDRYWS